MEAQNKHLQFEGMEAGGYNLNKPIDLSNDNLVIRVVNAIFFLALEDKASEIYIEPSDRDLVVKFRTNDASPDILSLPKELQSAITSRLKIMANLIITERTLPQDGRIPIKINSKDSGIRLRTNPAANGERLILSF